MKGSRRSLVVFSLILAGVLPGFVSVNARAAENPSPQDGGRSPAALSRARWPATISSGLADILGLVMAKVETPVILAYIKNSPVVYSPTARELVYLKDHGVANEILMALLQQGGQRRAKVEAAAREAAQGPGWQVPPYAPPPVADSGNPGYASGSYPNWWALVGPSYSFNNSYPTSINGSQVYSGYRAGSYYFW